MNSILLFIATFLTFTTFAVEYTREYNGCRCGDYEEYTNADGDVEGTSCENPHNLDNPGVRFCYVNGPACEDEGIKSFRSGADVFADNPEVHYSYAICTKSAEDKIEELEEKSKGFEAVAMENDEKVQVLEAAATELQQQFEAVSAELEELKEKFAQTEERLTTCQSLFTPYYEDLKAVNHNFKEFKKVLNNEEE